MTPKPGDRVTHDGWGDYYLVTRVGVHDGKPSVWLSFDGDEWRYPANEEWLIAHTVQIAEPA
jgi:hypothetical protein